MVIERAQSIGCDRFLFASGYIEDANISYELANKDEKFYVNF